MQQQQVNPTSFTNWWGRQTIPVDRTDFWQIGPLKLWIEHRVNQSANQSSNLWRFSYRHTEDWLNSQIRSAPGSQSEPVAENAKSMMFLSGLTDRTDLMFSPALADRTLVSRFAQPFHVLPGEEVNLYILSPLWLHIEMTNPVKLMTEIPIFRLSDTWIGAVSTVGEVAYASSGSPYLSLRDVPLRLHCALTAINVKNLGARSWRLDRVALPLPKLSLFYSPRTGFWTNSVFLEKKEDLTEPLVKIDRQPAAEASPTQFISGPRSVTDDSISVGRAFSSFFREKGQP